MASDEQIGKLEERISKLEGELKAQQKTFRRWLITASVSLFSLGFAAATVVFAFDDFYGGDTPVVLIGGSVTVKAAYKDINLVWNPNGTAYTTTLKHPIDWIVVKQDSSKDYDDAHDKDGGRSSSDIAATRTQVPGKAKGWKVNLYYIAAAGGTESAGPKLSWDSPNSYITLDNNGVPPVPCPGNRRIGYILDCNHHPYPELTRVEVIIIDKNGVSTTTPVPCVDGNNTQFHCRVVLRYRRHPF